MKNKTKIILVYILIAVIMVFCMFLFCGFKKPFDKKEATNINQEGKKEESFLTTEDSSVEENPSRTEYGTEKPKDFPLNIPFEEGAVMSQSYDLQYPNGKQSSIVFDSNKNPQENYVLYADFLEGDGWDIYNKLEELEIKSLYGIKEGKQINITILKDDYKSKVSVSFSDVL